MIIGKSGKTKICKQKCRRFSCDFQAIHRTRSVLVRTSQSLWRNKGVGDYGLPVADGNLN